MPRGPATSSARRRRRRRSTSRKTLHAGAGRASRGRASSRQQPKMTARRRPTVHRLMPSRGAPTAAAVRSRCWRGWRRWSRARASLGSSAPQPATPAGRCCCPADAGRAGVHARRARGRSARLRPPLATGRRCSGRSIVRAAPGRARAGRRRGSAPSDARGHPQRGRGARQRQDARSGGRGSAYALAILPNGTTGWVPRRRSAATRRAATRGSTWTSHD